VRRAAALLLLVAAAACSRPDQKAMRAALHDLDVRIAEKQELANDESGTRRALEHVDAYLAELAKLPPDAGITAPPPEAPIEMAAMPPEGYGEPEAARHMRLQYADSMQRLAQLESMLGPLAGYPKRAAELKRELLLVEPASRDACGKGDTRSCWYLALADDWAHGFRTRSDAATSYEKLCAGGFAPACESRGFQLERGMNRPGSGTAALEWYDKACPLGDALACDGARWLRRPLKRPPP